MSLSYAVECDWLDDATRAAAKSKLDSWDRPALESDEIQRWIGQVLGYFRNCYRGDGSEPECWHVANMRIESKTDALLNADQHAGVHYIRKFYPEYQPTADDFQRAQWGTKDASTA